MALNGMRSESDFDKKMKSVKFFNTYFDNFKVLFLTNIFYLIFFIAAGGYVYLTFVLLSQLSQPNIIIITALGGLVILNVGMAGVTEVCRYVYTNKQFSVFRTFAKGLKENFLKFFLHGVVFYLFTAVTYSSVLLYYNGTKKSSFFWIPLIINILISVFLLFTGYYLNLMTASINIELKHIYKNCLLFSFGELKNNILATVALLILGAVFLAAAIIINNSFWIIIVLGILSALLLPSTIQYILTFYLYDDMVAMLDDSKKDDDEKEEKIAVVSIEQEEAEKISRLAPDTDDEYIFHNGRMIKRSEVEKRLNGE